MKVAIVVQRYGATINGGAELHARYIAERLAPHVDVEVITSCAVNYVTWQNEFPAGTESVNGVTVHRFEVSWERDAGLFAQRSEQVFGWPHSLRDELAWLDSEGPASPTLVRYLRTHRSRYDFFLFFSYRYYHAYHGVRAVDDRAVLVPTAERDEAIGLSMFVPVFRGVRAIMYNSPEERAMIASVAENAQVPGVVVGVGSEIPPDSNAARFRQTHGVQGPFAIYVGRIDANKGCRELFDFFLRGLESQRIDLTLVLIGSPIIDIPDHPRIRHLGFVSDRDKFDAMAASSLLIMPSYYESLSMVVLEAFALGRPVLVNGRCEVLKGQCLRSNAGLYYETYEEFVEALDAVCRNPTLACTMGANGLSFFAEHYAWPVIEHKYLDMLARLEAENAAPTSRRRVAVLPGWLARRRKSLPSAREVLSRIPSGPAVNEG